MPGIPATSASTMHCHGSTRFKPRRAVITNMHSDLDYEVLRQSLPAGVIPAYDGMRLTLQQAD